MPCNACPFLSAWRGVFACLPTYFALSVGRSDSLVCTPTRVFDEVLRLLAVPHTFAVYPGTHHDTLWNAHADDWLQQALAHLAPAG